MTLAAGTPVTRRGRMTRVETTLVALETALGLAGLLGGIGLAAKPNGDLIKMSPTVLERSPFPDFRIPGIILFAANGILPLVAAVATLTGKPWSRLSHLVVGAVTTGWIVVQLLMLGYLFFLQPLILAWGVLIFVLGALDRRGAQRQG